MDVVEDDGEVIEVGADDAGAGFGQAVGLAVV